MIYRVHLGSQDGEHMGYKYFTSQRKSREAAKAWDREQAAEPPEFGNLFAYDENGDRKVGPFELGLECEIDTAPTPTTQREWMRLLNDWGSHPNNG
jgi:hypothetical protein